MKKIAMLLAVIILIPTLLCACAEGEDDGKITVAVTIAPEAAFVRGVCGENVNIITAVPSGASPESYDPTPKEIIALSDADVYFSIGVPSEDNILPALPDTVRVVKLHEAVAAKIPDLTLGSGRDPHIWLSVRRAKIMTEVICDAMCEVDAQNADIYRSGRDGYNASLDVADAEIRSLVSALQNKILIVFHPSFGYFADEYGLEMHALEKDGKEISAQELASLTDLAKENGIKVIFYQAQSSGRQAQAFAEGIDGEAVMLDPLSKNYIENLKIMAKKIAEAK